MREMARQAAHHTNQQLLKQELVVKLQRQLNVSKLCPDIASQAQYQVLIAAVEQATKQNVDTAQLAERLDALGNETWDLIKKVVALVD